MPPPNSSADTPNSPSSSSPYLRHFDFISSPVPDFASTLMSRPEDDVNQDNINFLRVTRRRSSLELSPARIRSRRRQLYSIEDDLNSMDFSNEVRGTVPVARRIPIVRRQRDGQNNAPNYETRPPHPISTHPFTPGWGSDDDDEDTSVDPSNLVQDMWAGRLANRDNASERSSWAGLMGRGQRRDGAVSTPRQRANDPQGHPNHPVARYGHSDLAAAALLNSVRRHPRFSSRTRTLQTFILDREASGHGSEERDWQPTAATPTATASASMPRGNRSPAAHRGEISRNPGSPELRRICLDDPTKVDRLEETIKYLDKVRFSNSYEESLSAAAEGSFIESEYFTRNEDDFILETSSISSPADSSWLKPGTVFCGSQHATNQSFETSLQNLDPIILNGGDIGRIDVYTNGAPRGYLQHEFGNGGATGTGAGSNNSRHEHWPVKVTIHHVDYDTMTLSGTMEAYNIPDKTASNQGAHIITFLEGEIIDFKTHSLETRNFKANAEVDSLYWRELEPFKSLTYDEIVKNLVSKKWMTEQLTKGWILMRWKERCFVSPSHSRQGLTISGFYYISIRRSDGHIEGMYYDPGSSPYQHLTLDPEMKRGMVFPAYGFR
ncbi:hypothetical protein FQN52_006435 [Onygenales sp. PD_12]|nr:hypothetical protein FQN52_006435 [Onygenales sp. PD_12]